MRNSSERIGKDYVIKDTSEEGSTNRRECRKDWDTRRAERELKNGIDLKNRNKRIGTDNVVQDHRGEGSENGNEGKIRREEGLRTTLKCDRCDNQQQTTQFLVITSPPIHPLPPLTY